MRSFAAALALGALGLVRAQSNSFCAYDFGNASFNLVPLNTPGAYVRYFVMDDRHNSYSDNYTYAFNICGNTASVPITVAPSGKIVNCTTTQGITNLGLEYTTGPAAAYQIANPTSRWSPPDQDLCHRLGGDIRSNAEVWSLFDSTNPSRGVTLTYTGGDSCSIQVGNGPVTFRNRTFSVHLICYDDAENIPDTETVEETNSCNYEIYIQSAFGCPNECPVVDRNLCSKHGICDFDTEIGKPKCFCNEGWTGNACTDQVETSSGMTAAGAVLIFVSLLLALLLGFLYFLWVKIRTLRLDPAAYRTLTGGPQDEQKTTAIYDE